MDAQQYQDALQIYLSLTDVDPGARARSLDERCGDDEAVRAWVERLFREDGKTLDAFGSLSPDIGDSVETGGPARFSVGERVADRYEVVALLGQGGTASVWKVRDVDQGQDLALKVLQHTHPTLRRRMERERVFQGQIVHRNVVSVRDLLDVDGQLGLLMELVHGPNLRRFLGSERPPDAIVDALALGIMAGVQAIHDAGIVHRDIKPDNVLVATAGGQLVAKLADFGIARDLTSTAAPLTQTGALVGTLSTMSPEQIRNSRGVDRRSDVWALGCVLYRIVAGHNAFVGPDNGEIITAILEGRRAALPDDLPMRWRAAIDAALRVSADDRPASCVELRRLWEAPPGAVLHLESRPAISRPRNRFVGRERALSDVADLLAHERVVTVLGVGGLGKTRLALELVQSQATRFAGGVRFVPLADVRSLDGIFSAVARAFGVPLGSNAPRAQIVRLLAARDDVLLVLDNFEQLIEHAQDTVGHWLDAVPGLRVLVTSRAPLRLYGEVHYLLDLLDESDAVELFVDRARQQGSRTRFEPEDRPVLVQLVDQLDRLPLAIELAAARTRLHSPRRLLERMTRRFDLLATRSSEVPARQQTLRATLTWSWELLDEAEQQVMRQLSVFDGGFTIEAAEAIVEIGNDSIWVEDVLAELSDKSLLVVEADRLRMLVSVREFAAEQLGEAGPVERRHGHWFAEQSKRSVWGLDPEEELGNFTEAARRASERGDEEVATTTALAATRILFRRGPLRSAVALLESLVDRMKTPVHRAALQGMLSRAYAGGGDWARALDLVEQIVPVARAAGASDIHVAALVLRADRRMEVGRLAEAEQTLLEAQGVAERDGAPQNVQGVLARLALLASHRGEYERAEELYARLFEIFRDAPASRPHSAMLGRFGHLRARLGFHEHALELFERALAMADELGDLVLRAMWLGALSRVSERLGRFGDAIRYAEDSLRVAQVHGERNNRSSREDQLAEIYARVGRYDLAEEHYQRAIDAATDVGRTISLFRHRVGLASVRIHQGRLDEAERLLDELRVEGEAIPTSQSRPDVYVHLGTLYERTGRLDDARKAYEDCVPVADAVRDKIVQAKLLGLLAPFEPDLAKARSAFEESIRGLTAVGRPYPTGLMHCRRARFEARHGDLERAKRAVEAAREVAASFEDHDGELPRSIRDCEELIGD